MSKTGSAAKVKLNSFDDLFGTEQPQTGTEQVQEIALSELHEFKGHPFKVLDDEKMQETMESIREHVTVYEKWMARRGKQGVYHLYGGCDYGRFRKERRFCSNGRNRIENSVRAVMSREICSCSFCYFWT